MLGYNIDTHNRPMLDRIEDIRAWREERNEKIIKELADNEKMLNEVVADEATLETWIC